MRVNTPISVTSVDDKETLMSGSVCASNNKDAKKLLDSLTHETRHVGNAFKRMPNYFVFNECIDLGVDVLDVDWLTGLPELYQRLPIQAEFNELYQETVANVKKEFLDLRAGNTWYVGKITFDFMTREILYVIESIRVTGRPLVRFKDYDFDVQVKGNQEKFGFAASSIGGLKNNPESLVSPVTKTKFVSRSLLTVGGTSRRKVKRQIEQVIRTHRKEIIKWFEFEHMLWEDSAIDSFEDMV